MNTTTATQQSATMAAKMITTIKLDSSDSSTAAMTLYLMPGEVDVSFFSSSYGYLLTHWFYSEEQVSSIGVNAHSTLSTNLEERAQPVPTTLLRD